MCDLLITARVIDDHMCRLPIAIVCVISVDICMFLIMDTELTMMLNIVYLENTISQPKIIQP